MDLAPYHELFSTEARDHLAEIDAAVLAVEHSADPVLVAAQLSTLFRNTHSLKGMAAALGHADVEQIAHALESLLDNVRSGYALIHTELVDLLFLGTDALRQCVEDAVAGRTGGGAQAAAVARLAAHDRSPLSPSSLTPLVIPSLTPSVMSSFMHADHGDVSGEPGAMARDTGRTVAVQLVSDCPLKGVRAFLVKARLEALGAVTDAQPDPATWYDPSFDGVFTVRLESDVSAQAIDEAVRAAGDVANVQVEIASPSLDVGTAARTVGDGVATPRAGEATLSAPLRTVRVDRRRLDSLLDLIGELVVTRDQLTTWMDAGEQSVPRGVKRTVQQAARLISAMQEEILQMRMVPVSQVFDRFPRLVRDVSRSLGKDVEFEMEGREIELDRSLVDALADPLMHLLRNALAHGFEAGDVRAQIGKPRMGTLVLRAARDRAAVVIQVEDDGRGIDRSAILGRAQRQGLVAGTVTHLDDDALLHVLAHPGFSTARAVTSLSGRGVGVDVVANRVRALGGVLELESIDGVGSVFTLRMPVSLAITRALLVQVAGETYALPAAHVVEAVEYDRSMAHTEPAHETSLASHASHANHGGQGPYADSVTVRDERMPLVPLRQRFGHPPSGADSFLAVVEIAGRRSALLVDALVAQQDIVVKPFDDVRGGITWFTGATVLGDGTPALIVDLGSLS